MLLCLGKPPVRCLCCCCSFLIFIFVDVLLIAFRRRSSPSDVTLLGKTSGEVFVLLLFISDLHFCWCSSHCFSTSFLTLPWTITIAGVFTPHFTLSVQLIAGWFLTLSFVQPFCSCRELYGLEWAIFIGHRRFLPHSPWQIFQTQARPICLFDSQ